MSLEPDVVYVIPPNRDLTVVTGVLHLAQPVQPRGLRLPIDLLFSSLARDQGEHAVGVVLSGMGSDGTLGLQAIKSLGELTLAQSPGSAPFDSMLKNAIEAGCVDIVGLPAELPSHIMRITADRRDASLLAAGSDESNAHAMSSILHMLYDRSKHNLSDYRPSTLRRRIQRRMSVHGLATQAAYESFVRKNSQELDLLFKEMLIGVTSFLRDPARIGFPADDLERCGLLATLISAGGVARFQRAHQAFGEVVDRPREPGCSHRQQRRLADQHVGLDREVGPGELAAPLGAGSALKCHAGPFSVPIKPICRAGRTLGLREGLRQRLRRGQHVQPNRAARDLGAVRLRRGGHDDRTANCRAPVRLDHGDARRSGCRTQRVAHDAACDRGATRDGNCMTTTGSFVVQDLLRSPERLATRRFDAP